MADQAIGSAADELMVLVHRRSKAKIAPKRACTGPRKQAGQRQEQHRKSQAPGRKRAAPEWSLPKDHVTGSFQQQAPAPSGIALLRRFTAPACEWKRQKPGRESDDENHIGVSGQSGLHAGHSIGKRELAVESCQNETIGNHDRQRSLSNSIPHRRSLRNRTGIDRVVWTSFRSLSGA